MLNSAVANIQNGQVVSCAVRTAEVRALLGTTNKPLATLMGSFLAGAVLAILLLVLLDTGCLWSGDTEQYCLVSAFLQARQRFFRWLYSPANVLIVRHQLRA
jgi:hypothetical protein